MNLTHATQFRSAWRWADGLRVVAVVAGAVLYGFLTQFLHRSPAESAISVLFVLVLAKISIVDLRHRRIPNRYTLWGVAVAFAVAAVRGVDVAFTSIFGMVFAGGAMAAAYVLGRGRLGMGDVKLSAFVGAVLGFHLVPAFLLVGSVLGSVIAIVVFLRTRDRHATFAYGPCLAFAAAMLVVTEGTVGA